MPRKPRVSIAGVAEHVIQRGNNRQVIFANEEDMKCYVTWLKEYTLFECEAFTEWYILRITKTPTVIFLL